jgi:hypothetical protein
MMSVLAGVRCDDHMVKVEALHQQRATNGAIAQDTASFATCVRNLECGVVELQSGFLCA